MQTGQNFLYGFRASLFERPNALKLATVFALIVLAQLGCTGHRADQGLAVFHGLVKDDVKTWDPANAYDTVSSSLVPSIYETLYQYSYLDSVYKIEPLLAVSLPTFSDDKLTVTISIKRDVHFQDDPCFKASRGKGRELKAEDFVYGLKRLALPSLQSTGWWVLEGKLVGMNEFRERLVAASPKDLPQVFEEKVEGIQALDDYTLQFKLVHPYPQLLHILALSFSSPVPREAIAEYGDEKGNLTDHPVGTGPFVLTSWSRNHEIILDKNPKFRSELYPSTGSEEFQKNGMLIDSGKKLPLLDRIRMVVLKEEQPRWLNFMKGQLDLIELPKDNFKEAITHQVNLTPDLVKKGMHLSIETGVVTRFVSFNMKDKFLGTNKFLRQAISSAIDRDAWIQTFTNGTGRKMSSVVPPGVPDRPNLAQMKYDYNLVRAKELLKKAGYPKGAGLPIFKFDLRGAATQDRQLGEFFVDQLSKVGVRLEIQSNTFPAFLQKLREGNLQISYGGWSMDYPDAENIYQLFYGPNRPPGANDTSYDHPVVNKSYEQLAMLESSPARLALAAKMEDQIQEDCPIAMGYYEAPYHISQPWLMNYRGSDIILNKYKYYKVSKEVRDRYSQ
ncbi:MAG: hypothetical protein HYX41_01600 [Bdellovibrio sp.]|nr:hypothetical protein [Bdellovibrio sp.]